MPICDQNIGTTECYGEQKFVIEDVPCQPIGEQVAYTGKTLQVNKYYFKDAKGNDRVSEGIVKTNNSAQDENIRTIAVLRRLIMCDALVLVKQYRAPLRSYTLEFPATISPPEEAIEDSATKEIEDDTGYSSTTIKYISPATAVDSDVTDAKVQFVSLLIDGDDPLQHGNPKNHLVGDGKGGHGDIVEVIHVPINGLLDRLKEYSDNGVLIDSVVYSFAIGLKKGEKMSLAGYVPVAGESTY